MKNLASRQGISNPPLQVTSILGAEGALTMYLCRTVALPWICESIVRLALRRNILFLQQLDIHRDLLTRPMQTKAALARQLLSPGKTYVVYLLGGLQNA